MGIGSPHEQQGIFCRNRVDIETHHFLRFQSRILERGGTYENILAEITVVFDRAGFVILQLSIVMPRRISIDNVKSPVWEVWIDVRHRVDLCAFFPIGIVN